MKTNVIYHRADFDGIFCREIARKFLPEATLIGWDYGDPVPAIEKDSLLYMLDISVEGLMDHPKLIWIDHHKSALDKYSMGIAGYRLDGVAACRLAWQWFAHEYDRDVVLGDQSKADFIDRRVCEPLAVRLAGEYDIWDKRDPRAELFQHGLRTRDLDSARWGDVPYWNVLLSKPLEARALITDLLIAGEYLQYAKTRENESVCQSYSFTAEFEGLKFLAINHARANSLTFVSAAKPEHDGLLSFNWSGKEWRVSLYHAPGKEHIDLSQIAVKYGGGGHRGACGFRTSALPFLKS